MNRNHTPQIETFPRRVGSTHTIIGVDLQIEGRVPLEEMPWVNALKVSAPAPESEAQSPEEEGEAERSGNFPARSGFDIEQKLFLPLAAGEHKNALLVGSVSTLQSAEWFIYSADPIAERLAEAIDEQFPELEVQARAQRDADWSVYEQFLRPTRIERLLIENRRQIREIDAVDAGEDHDDAPDTRPVHHTVWFSSSHDRNAFAELITERDFELHYPDQDVQLEAAEEDVEYGLTITRPEHVDIETMDELTRWLFKFAARFAGEYEGWHIQH